MDTLIFCIVLVFLIYLHFIYSTKYKIFIISKLLTVYNLYLSKQKALKFNNLLIFALRLFIILLSVYCFYKVSYNHDISYKIDSSLSMFNKENGVSYIKTATKYITHFNINENNKILLTDFQSNLSLRNISVRKINYLSCYIDSIFIIDNTLHMIIKNHDKKKYYIFTKIKIHSKTFTDRIYLIPGLNHIETNIRDLDEGLYNLYLFSDTNIEIPFLNSKFSFYVEHISIKKPKLISKDLLILKAYQALFRDNKQNFVTSQTQIIDLNNIDTLPNIYNSLSLIFPDEKLILFNKFCKSQNVTYRLVKDTSAYLDINRLTTQIKDLFLQKNLIDSKINFTPMFSVLNYNYPIIRSVDGGNVITKLVLNNGNEVYIFCGLISQNSSLIKSQYFIPLLNYIFNNDNKKNIKFYRLGESNYNLPQDSIYYLSRIDSGINLKEIKYDHFKSPLSSYDFKLGTYKYRSGSSINYLPFNPPKSELVYLPLPYYSKFKKLNTITDYYSFMSVLLLVFFTFESFFLLKRL